VIAEPLYVSHSSDRKGVSLKRGWFIPCSIVLFLVAAATSQLRRMENLFFRENATNATNSERDKFAIGAGVVHPLRIVR
jgi:hypothetical protein